MSNILVIDDRSAHREYLNVLLNHSGHTIYQAQDGKEGLMLVKRHPTDLIIMDMLIQGMDGEEFVGCLEGDRALSQIPILLYTPTYRKEEAGRFARLHNISGVLTKSAEPRDVLHDVNRALGLEDDQPAMENLEKFCLGVENAELFRHSSMYFLPKELSSTEGVETSTPNTIEPLGKSKSEQAGLERHPEKEQLRAISKRFREGLLSFQAVSNKFFTLVELNLDLVSQKDVDKLLRLFCVGAKKLLDAQFCLAGIFNERGLIEKYSTGCLPNEEIQLNKEDYSIQQSFIAHILSHSSAFSIEDKELISQLKLPHSEVEPTSILCVPLGSATNLYGFVYFVNKLGVERFTQEDIRIINTLAAELAILYENMNMYNLVQMHAESLQKEVEKRKAAQEALMRSEDMFREFSENVNDVLWKTSPNLDKVTYISPAYERIWGRRIIDLYKNSRDWLEAVVPEDRERLEFILQRSVQMQQFGVIKYRIQVNGKIRHIYQNTSPVKDSAGKITGLIGVSADVTEVVQRKTYEDAKEKLRFIFSKKTQPDLMGPKILEFICDLFRCRMGELWLIDNSDNMLKKISCWHEQDSVLERFVSNTKGLMFKLGEGLPGKIWAAEELYFKEDAMKGVDSRYEDAIAINLFQGFGFPIAYHGKIFGVLCFYNAKLSESEKFVFHSSKMISEQVGSYFNEKYSENQLAYLARYDLLTNLYNRASIEELLSNILNKMPEQHLAVIACGIDRFQQVNEGFGYEFGDAVLRNIAEGLKVLSNEQIHVFRYSGGKFGILMLNQSNKEKVLQFCEDLLSIFNAPMVVRDRNLHLTTSVGVSFCPKDGRSGKVLLKNAESALRQAKGDGGGQIQIFRKDSSSHLSKKLLLESDLRQSIEKNQLCLFFQPKIEMLSGKISSVECLLRWKHPEQGLLTANLFIPLAEETSLILPIGNWVITEALRALKQMLVRAPHMNMAINISIKQFNDPNFVKNVTAFVKDSQLPSNKIEFEITESLLLNNYVGCTNVIETLRDTLGIQFALDDFGTAYSSLKYLTHFKVDTIKIDKSFIDGVPGNREHTAIVKAILSMAKGLGTRTVAEGVENQEQWNFLLQEGCDEVQGYFCCKPASLEDILRFIEGNVKR